MRDGLFQDTMVNMNWTQIRQAAEQNALVLLPLGVIEEHGPHLCLGTDIYTAHLYCLTIQEKLAHRGRAAVIAPPFYWGICQSNGGFIGSFTARQETVKMMLFDILASLKSFGFRDVVGVNAHGDIEHSVAVMDAFREATEQLGLNARYAFDEARLPHFGLTGEEPFLCPVKSQTIRVSEAACPDVHGGDIETATVYSAYPHLVDVERAKSLPPVELPGEKVMDWLFGGHIHELSPQGYLGSPAQFEQVDAHRNIEDYASRITDAILRGLWIRS